VTQGHQLGQGWIQATGWTALGYRYSFQAASCAVQSSVFSLAAAHTALQVPVHANDTPALACGNWHKPRNWCGRLPTSGDGSCIVPCAADMCGSLIGQHQLTLRHVRGRTEAGPYLRRGVFGRGHIVHIKREWKILRSTKYSTVTDKAKDNRVRSY
jgi:hypothetical protein